MAASAVKFHVRSDGVAILTIHNPPKNTLSNDVMDGLQMRFKEAHSRNDVKAIVLTGSGNIFSLGVDLTLFQRIQKIGCDNRAHFVPAIQFMSMIEDGPKPVVAALRGFVIGAGLEMTLGCHSRIADSSAQFSVPDFHNGIIPGLGGTQRLPRLVGLKRALEILWMTRPLTAMEAMEAGLIDEVIVSGDVVQKACSHALDIYEERFPWKKSIERVDRMESCEEALCVLRRARAQVKKDHPNLVHPLLCMDVMEEGVLKGGLAGAVLEEKFSHGLVNTPIARSLMHVFFARRSVLKVPGITDKGLKPRTIRRVAVLGCGFTAAAIATSFILSKIPTLLKADNDDDLRAGLAFIEENLRSLEVNGTISQRHLKSVAALLSGTIEYEHFQDIDLVVEAVEDSTSNHYIKFQDLAEICKPTCILVSNSSLIDLSGISSNSRVQNQILGMHFLSPAYNTELVEISFLEKTSAQAVLDLLSLVKSMQKLPLVVKSSMGLIVDRLCSVYSASALILAELGVDRSQIHVLLKDFGMTASAFSFSKLHRSQICSSHGCLEDRKLASTEEEDILDMLLFPIVNEAYQILHEGIAETAEHIDIASISGIGFPNYRGGIMFWARSVGTNFIVSQLTKWSNQYGNFFKTSTWLHSSDHQYTVKDQVPDQVIARL